jgi:hypothetical protein
MMMKIPTRVTFVAIAALLGACMQSRTHAAAASGDIQVDSLSATRTALLRVQNNYSTKVRVFTVLGGKLNEVASVMPNETHTVILDPTTIPNASVSFEMRPVEGGTPKRLGPFRISRGQTADLVVTPDLGMSHIEVHESTP